MTHVRHTRRGAMIALGLSLCTAAAVASTLAGCGKKSGGDDADKGGGGGGGSLLKVGFAQEGAESDWRTANTKSIREAGTKANGVELSFTDSQGDVQQQVKALDSFVLKQLDVVAFSPKEEKGWDPVLKRLKAAGIPVIVSDRDVVVADPALQPVYIGSGPEAGGPPRRRLAGGQDRRPVQDRHPRGQRRRDGHHRPHERLHRRDQGPPGHDRDRHPQRRL